MFLKKNSENHNFPLSMTPEMAIFAIQAKWVKNVFFFLMGNIECGFEQVNFLWKYKFMYIAGKKNEFSCLSVQSNPKYKVKDHFRGPFRVLFIHSPWIFRFIINIMIETFTEKCSTPIELPIYVYTHAP